MTEIYTNIRLRPTRIGFLVKPNDMKSIKKIMQINTCLWGGLFNPIIPVYKVPPKEWRPSKYEHVKGFSVAKGYVEFFEPDVFVEADQGLLEDIGMDALRDGSSFDPQVIHLNKFLEVQSNRNWSEPAMGLSVMDVFRHLYKTEQRFEHRDKTPSIIVKSERNSALTEALFGGYPRQKHAAYIRDGYKDVFVPEEVSATPETWLKVLRDNALTPLRVTRHGLDVERSWHNNLVIYVFDSKRPTDLIDLWNMRIEPSPVLPVPVHWVEEVAEDLRKIIKHEYRPVVGNPNGLMHRSTIEIGRSIPEKDAEEFIQLLVKDMPQESVAVKSWRNPIWELKEDNGHRRNYAVRITASEKRDSITVKEEHGKYTARFRALSPEFASRYGGNLNRWVNALQVGVYGPENIATIFPFNNYNREWPRLGYGGGRIIIGSEGWVFSQQHKNSDEHLQLLTKEEAIIGTFNQLDIKATLSDPGQIARQILEHIGGLWGVSLLANKEIIELLNKMAASIRRRNNEESNIEETFEGRTAPVKSWTELISKINKDQSLRVLKLKSYTDKNIIRLGLETVCPHCQGKNWHSLDLVNYNSLCERCLNNYEFPQADGKKNWKYRVVGPFSLPDYAQGSYSTLLTIRALENLGAGGHREMTFSTSLNLEFDNIKCEADFAALRGNDRINNHLPPELIVGECKSFGSGDLVKRKDLSKLRQLTKKIPGAIIVIAVMRDHFTESELKIIKSFVSWARRPNKRYRATNPVILLTGHELFAEHHIGSEWKKLGKPYEDYEGYDHTKDLYSFAQATQAIYLGLPSFSETYLPLKK